MKKKGTINIVKPILILGGGGHAKVLISSLKASQREIVGILEADATKLGSFVADVKIIGTDDLIHDFLPEQVMLVNGIGSISSTRRRVSVYERFKNMGFDFGQVIHPSATIADDVVLEEGVQILAGVIIQTGATIGKNCIINNGAIIDHDCIIGDHVHISPGSLLAGDIQIGSMTHIGLSATILQGLKIGSNCLIGAGSVVIHDLPSNVKAYGVPAIIKGEYNE